MIPRDAVGRENVGRDCRIAVHELGPRRRHEGPVFGGVGLEFLPVQVFVGLRLKIGGAGHGAHRLSRMGMHDLAQGGRGVEKLGRLALALFDLGERRLQVELGALKLEQMLFGAGDEGVDAPLDPLGGFAGQSQREILGQALGGEQIVIELAVGADETVHRLGQMLDGPAMIGELNVDPVAGDRVARMVRRPRGEAERLLDFGHRAPVFRRGVEGIA